MRHYLRQPWFADCPALFVMTSVFERVRFKYPSPRAYRVVLMEAGHLGQTFCLVATWLGLLPFSTAAFADSAIERQLGIDGVDEGVLYAAGVGRPPKAGERSGRAAFPERPPAKPSSHALRRKPHVSRP
jgi:SagB-type dehydrogenase family enzyme